MPTCRHLLICLGLVALAPAADDVLARIEGPVAELASTNVDTEPRFACDGDLGTSWMPPRGSVLRIDLGEGVQLAGWRLTATLSTTRAWEGRRAWMPSPAYKVLASDDGQDWRRIAAPEQGASRIHDGERIEFHLSEPVTTRWLEIRLGDLSGLTDVELLGTDGALIPAFARARTCAGARTRLRALGRMASYAAKAAAWVRGLGLEASVPEAAAAVEVTALDQVIGGSLAADDGQIVLWLAQVEALGGRIAAQVAQADAWCDLLLRADLAATAASRVAAMGAEAGPATAAAAEMALLAADREPSRQPAFNRQLAVVEAAWRGWTSRRQAGVTRDGRWFVRADGRRIVPFGLNYAAIGFVPSLDNPTLIRRAPPVMNEPCERDFRNLRLWGFNTVRLTIRFSKLALDPRSGECDPAYLAKIREALAWALRYDIHVVMDMHLDYGPLPMAPGAGEAYTQNHLAMLPFHRAAWRVMAELGRDQPHVLTYELPANEPNGGTGLFAALGERYTDAWHDTASIIDAWHGYLARRHGSLEGAAAFWAQTTRRPEANALLRLGDGLPVADAVALSRQVPELESEANTRLRDYLICSQEVFLRNFEVLAAEVRAVDPRTTLTISTNYDLTVLKKKGFRPFGPHARLLYGLRPSGAVAITDHYNSVEMARRYRSTGQPWFAGENWIYDSGTADFARNLAAGGGNIGWAYWPSDHRFSCAIGHDLWLKEQWRSWSMAAVFSDSLRQGDVPAAEVAIIAPLMAYESAMSRLPHLLDRLDVRHDELIDEVVARDPAVLGRYRAVILDLDSASPAAVRAVLASPVPALLVDRQLVDGDNRWGVGVVPALAGTFYRSDRLPTAPPAAADPPPFPLAGTWWFRTDPEAAGDAGKWQAPTSFDGWDQLPAPGYWEADTISHGRYGSYDGVAWYAREVVLPAALAGRDLVFSAVIDDFDTVWFNGERIGATDRGTPTWWLASRRYRIPAALVRADRPNILVIRVTDEKNRGGIVPGVFQIGIEDREDRHLTWISAFGGLAAGTGQDSAVGREMPRLDEASLVPGCAVLARFADGDIAAARAGRHVLWLGGDGVGFGGDRRHPGTEEALVAAHLREAGVALTYPMTPLSEQLDVTRLDNCLLIENRSARPFRLDPATLAQGRPIAWSRLVAPPFRDHEPAGEIEIPPGAFVGSMWAAPAPIGTKAP